MSDQIATPDVETVSKIKTQRLWNVILLNDETHTFEYVITMIMAVFRHDFDKAQAITIKIHQEGQAIADVTTKERAELKQQQVHSFGADPLMPNKSTGPVTCVIEEA